MTTMVREQLLTVDEAAARLHVSRRWVYRNVDGGVLPALRLGDGPKAPIRIDPRDLDRYLEQARRRAAA